MNKRNIKLIGIAVVSLMSIGVAGLTVLPAVNQIQIQGEELSLQQNDLDEKNEQLTKLATVKDDSVQIEELNQQLAAKFPNLQKGSDLLDNISIAAVTAGISPSNVTGITIDAPTIVTPPTPIVEEGESAIIGEGVEVVQEGAETAPAEGDAAPADAAAGDPAAAAPASSTIASMRVQITVKGQPDELQRFLASLSNMTRVVKVKEVAFAGVEEGEDANLTISGESYLYAPIVAPTEAPAEDTTAPTE